MIVKDYFHEGFKTWHYTIAPAKDMPLELFKKLLRDLFERMKKKVG